MKICIVLSTRPEIIKLAPLIKILKKNKNNFFLINTNQHYLNLMSKVFFDFFKIPKPKYYINASTKTHGIFFIMITLALGEMFHSWAFTNDSLGGSDGISGIARPDLLFMGLDLNEPLLFTYYLIVWLILSYLFLSAITDSPLGRNLDAIRQNSNRVLSLGGSVKFYKSASFGISSAIACLAGSLYAQLNGFVSPELSHWTVSGEGLIMIIVGGIGSLSGAILGAAVVHVLQHELSKLVDWWMLLMGGGFILIVLFIGVS